MVGGLLLRADVSPAVSLTDGKKLDGCRECNSRGINEHAKITARKATDLFMLVGKNDCIYAFSVA
tara:strand:+ start:760 stop:954 length:195 start_codon:yes stop_codon:yes gene_type:complete